MKAALIAMILQIAPQYSVPPYLMIAIAEAESDWNVKAVGLNADGTIDRGLMQLNSSWYNDENWADPETNIRAAACLIQELRAEGLTWWQIAVVYNCGIARVDDPPSSSVEYAVKIFQLWSQYDHGFIKYVGR